MRKFMMAMASGALLLASIPAPIMAQADGSDDMAQASDVLPGGAHWVAAVPENWNGTLLLWSRGYSRRPVPEAGPEDVRAAMLAQGYAIAASDYGSGGWALAEAVPAQKATVAAFGARHGIPQRVIGLGNSMGGLVTAALAEETRPAIAGGVAMCASIGGALGMMNMALDGAFAFRTLVAPDAGIELVNITDDRDNGARVDAALAEALDSPAGRARVALAGVLAGIPGWTDDHGPQPGEEDYAAQAAEIAKTFVAGVYLPRTDQEQRAGGVFSWNTGIDYREQLERSGRQAMVAALYQAAGLDLAADLATLNTAPRIVAEPDAVAYMRDHYTPTARPNVPLLAVQMIGDGKTAPALQRGYAEAAEGRNMRGLWVQGAGHCNFSPDTVLAAIRYLEERLDTGDWGAQPAGFVTHVAAPMLRPCFSEGICR